MSQLLSKLPYNVFGKAIRAQWQYTTNGWGDYSGFCIKPEDIYGVSIICSRNLSPKNNKRRFGYKNYSPYKVLIRNVYYKLTVLSMYRQSALVWRYTYRLESLYSKEQMDLL